ncbi:MAG: TIGR03643 family protein [Myxococcota bacterium]
MSRNQPPKETLSVTEHAVIELAWDDDTPFAAIETQYGLSESDVIRLMRRCLKRSSFRMWRKRVSGRNSPRPALGPTPRGSSQFE